MQNGSSRMANGGERSKVEPSSCYLCPLLHCPRFSAGFLPVPYRFRQLTQKQTHGILTTSTWNHSLVPAPFMSQIIHSPPGSAETPGQGLSLMGICECQGTRAVNPPERHQSEGPKTLIGGAHVHKWQIMTYKWEFMWPLDVPGDPGRDGEGAN